MALANLLEHPSIKPDRIDGSQLVSIPGKPGICSWPRSLCGVTDWRVNFEQFA